ncbi:MAG: hypothetical protein US57_C0001G0004 [Candidatus Moranbacteria bacterium GW2011_GWC2_37_73]|nr:MAG: hypothetical protein UR95_C0001G0071 [Parcubacteria group bacterium GW2011_GWC1_36_108]KKQ00673.1 MAG: hypothetical protein US09_C0007G0004 [Candidatus Moranbacteria bacterium GW2011_GWD1_36_198]KKQ01541.1 MAG: hypothetical protein US10_C0011G0004 [Candidatus Moranbacteria bacterium GW2011_GWD2_36_198]KKQ40394.1 MAG: hypothetical protein US57_C0001G0004 [Candidatus Moranbacteria bacterium GW2011_GWC2_37_73]HAR99835.1 hypothetical protein [Candidatus Moranbacteria bacterium]
MNFFKIENIKLKLKYFFSQEFFRSALIQWVMICAFFVNLANWGAIAYFIRPVDFPIILHYNVYFGVDVIGAWWQMYFLPLIGLVILCVNAVLGYLFYQQKERIVAHLLMLATFIVQICITIAVSSLLLINY